MMIGMKESVQTMNLATLLGQPARADLQACLVQDITSNSREVTGGAVFFALQGASSHGLDYVADALQRGASAIVWEAASGHSPPRLPASVLSVPVAGLGDMMGEIADRYFQSPSRTMRVAGVTGTNGKTTCAYLIASALQHAGRPAGMIGTLGCGLPGRLESAALTTSDCITVHRQLARLRDNGAAHVVMEVSSHGLTQGRVDGIRFDTGVFTNLSREHLDYHGDMHAYGEAKTRLFTDWQLASAVVNVDDEFGTALFNKLPLPVRRVGVSLRKEFADEGHEFLKVLGLVRDIDGITLDLDGSWGTDVLKSRLLGDFNAGNLLLALATLLVWGVPLPAATRALAGVPPPPGRMEAFRTENKPLVVVDYAHTHAALREALAAARAHCQGTLWCVFGCGGDRDPGKRPLMGAVAAELADRVVLTDDNPRGEDPDAIIAAIKEGMPDPARGWVVRDRAEAIAGSVRQAQPGDLVLVAGKGHEDYQVIGTTTRRLSDRDIVAQVLGLK